MQKSRILTVHSPLNDARSYPSAQIQEEPQSTTRYIFKTKQMKSRTQHSLSQKKKIYLLGKFFVSVSFIQIYLVYFSLRQDKVC